MELGPLVDVTDVKKLSGGWFEASRQPGCVPDACSLSRDAIAAAVASATPKSFAVHKQGSSGTSVARD